MYSKFQLAQKYLRYYLEAANGKGHGVHSPFVFKLITEVLNDNRTYYCYNAIETLRNQLLNDSSKIIIEDFGAGSRVEKTKERSINAIAQSSLKPKKFSQLLFRIAHYLQPQHILELGTSLGITTAYLSSACPKANLITMEGANTVATIAQSNFERLNLQNISIVPGNFDDTLSEVLKNKIPQVDFAYIDGNHRFAPTCNYFEQIIQHSHNDTCIILDDIHWSAEMEQAWDYAKNHPAVTLTIDLFFIGLVFLRREQKETEHFIIRF